MTTSLVIDHSFKIVVQFKTDDPHSMAGHSHSANIAHRKAAVDNKRSKVWSKISKAILVAVKLGGGDPDMNLRLRYAILDARSVSLPKENIERAIKSGLGELGGATVEE